jgi:hypothetical protein
MPRQPVLSEQRTDNKTIPRTAEKRRYVIDFGPNAARMETTLAAIEQWLDISAQQTGAIFLKSPDESSDTNRRDCVTAVEVEIKVIIVDSEPFGYAGRFVIERGRQSTLSPVRRSEERLVLSESTRASVNEIVQRALSHALGENGRDVVLNKMQIDYGSGFSQVPDFPSRFVELLDEILREGARNVEDRMIKEFKDRYPSLGECQTFKEVVLALVTADSSPSE